MNRTITTAVLIFLFLVPWELVQAQTPPSPKGYYLFPIRPGQKNYLAGTMGELRSSHFHAGLDIKTSGQVGLPVYATADGYISRIKIDVGGYGHALYMKHPNGTTSVYAHLDEFDPDLEKYVLLQQYKQKSYEVDLFPSANQFAFRQGEVIAYSGNTGSSSGPHLHFEIRDENHRILDPLQFNFPEISDHIAPQIKSLAFVTLDGNARVNDTFGRFVFDVIKTGNTYRTRVPISLKGNVGVEIYAYDLLDGVYNRNGILKSTLLINGDSIFSEHKEGLSFSKQRNILVHMDYEGYRSSGLKYNKLFIDDGNTNDFYVKTSTGFFFDDSVFQIKIILEDSYGNISSLETEANNRKVINAPDPKIGAFEIYRNFLHAMYQKDLRIPAPPLSCFFEDTIFEIQPYREELNKAYYLFDLRSGLPDSIKFLDSKLNTKLFGQIPSNVSMSFHNHDMDVYFRQYSLFDTLYLRFEKSFDEVLDMEYFDFPMHDIPLKGSVQITLKPTKSYPDSSSRVYSVYGSNLNFVGGEWQDSTITFTTRDFAKFTISEDTIPPVITPKIINSSQLYFRIDDDKSGVMKYQARLNGEFILMRYEQKRDLIWAVPKDPNIPLTGEFILEVEDNTGNKSIYQRKL